MKAFNLININVGLHCFYSVWCFLFGLFCSVSPIIFPIVTLPVIRCSIASHFGVQLLHYADYTQIYNGLSPTVQSSREMLRRYLSWSLFRVLFQRSGPKTTWSWGIHIWLTLTSVVFSYRPSIDLADNTVSLSKTVKTVGVTLNSNFTFGLHVGNLCESLGLHHLRATRHTWSSQFVTKTCHMSRISFY